MKVEREMEIVFVKGRKELIGNDKELIVRLGNNKREQIGLILPIDCAKQIHVGQKVDLEITIKE